MKRVYVIYSVLLCGWTFASIPPRTTQEGICYLMSVVLLSAAGILSQIIWKPSGRTGTGILIALTFCNVGASVAYRMDNKEIREYFKDIMMMIAVYIVIFFIICYTNIYRVRLLNVLCIVCLPLFLIGARLSGNMTHGAYVNFHGFLVFGIVLIGYPFAAAYFMSMQEAKYIGGSVKNLSFNLVGLLSYTFILFVGCAVCNEFGLLLVLGTTATVVFFVRCKSRQTKVIYSMACLCGTFLACRFVSHIHDRMLIWLDPVKAYGDKTLAAKAESVLYLYRNIRRTGWWGNGIGELPKGIYPTLNTDHIIVTLINDYSIFIAALVMILSILYVKWMLLEAPRMNVYDRYLNLCGALITGFIILLHIASNLGSFITAGIGFPFISDGGSVNLMLTVLLAIHCGLMERKVIQDAVSEKET